MVDTGRLRIARIGQLLSAAADHCWRREARGELIVVEMGAGKSAHCSARLVAERERLARPEAAAGHAAATAGPTEYRWSESGCCSRRRHGLLSFLADELVQQVHLLLAHYLAVQQSQPASPAARRHRTRLLLLLLLLT